MARLARTLWAVIAAAANRASPDATAKPTLMTASQVSFPLLLPLFLFSGARWQGPWKNASH